MLTKNYWCFRIFTGDIKFFTNELNEGRLRQGWGYDTGQDFIIADYWRVSKNGIFKTEPVE